MDKQQSLAPFTDGEILQAFGTDHATSKHLLIIYSMVVGTGAQRIIDLGIGQTTRALRAAAAVTGGVVLSCDFDRRRYDYLLPLQDESWRLSLEDSGHFLANLDAPFDFVMHDAAHHYAQVRRDIETLLPKMRRFGLICVHDAQQADLGQGILKAVMDATVGAATSSTVLPFSAGLLVLRVEESNHPPIEPATGRLPDGRPETRLLSYLPMSPSHRSGASPRSLFEDWKIRIGHALRQRGLR